MTAEAKYLAHRELAAATGGLVLMSEPVAGSRLSPEIVKRFSRGPMARPLRGRLLPSAAGSEGRFRAADESSPYPED